MEVPSVQSAYPNDQTAFTGLAVKANVSNVMRKLWLATFILAVVIAVVV